MTSDFVTLFSMPQAQWYYIGRASTFPDIGFDEEDLSQSRLCNNAPTPGCKVFQLVAQEGSANTKLIVPIEALDSSEISKNFNDQVLVFQYRGKIHAIDHRCPHSSYPLSRGIPFDIEDFGVVLSAGLTCPKHGWSFDLFSGSADRGNYKLGVWETQLREPSNEDEVLPGDGFETTEKEVWVRRKQRVG